MKIFDISQLDKFFLKQMLLEEGERTAIVYGLYNNGLKYGKPDGKDWYQSMCDETLRKKEFSDYLVNNIETTDSFEVSDEQIKFLKEFVESQIQISESRLDDYAKGILSNMITDNDKLEKAAGLFSDYEYNLIKLCTQISELLFKKVKK